ncbi:MAG: DUF192 domain-containing protein [Candidatus Omnitrophota bacterium]
MKIINQTKNITLAQDAMLAGALFQRMRGLLGRKEFKQGEGIILKPCNSIHTFFMRFPIDVLFVDKNNKIVKTIANFVPFRISNIYFRVSFTIELPAGTIEKTLTSPGDILTLSK